MATLDNLPLIAWRHLGEADGHQVVESLCTFAQPVDVALLFMHGAMVAHGLDDREGDTLARVRELVGSGVADSFMGNRPI